MTATRRLTAILAADVAGYSRLIGADEGGTLQAMKAIRTELIDPTIAAHMAGSSRRRVTGCSSSSAVWSMPCVARPRYRPIAQGYATLGLCHGNSDEHTLSA